MKLKLIVVTCDKVPGAHPEVGHGGGWTLIDFFRIKTTKLCTHKTPKKRNKFYITSPKFTIFLKKWPKTGKNRAFFSRAPCKMLPFCKFAPEAQENFAIVSLKYDHKVIQNGDRGAGSPLDPPLSHKICNWIMLLSDIVRVVVNFLLLHYHYINFSESKQDIYFNGSSGDSNCTGSYFVKPEVKFLSPEMALMVHLRVLML